MAVWVLSKKCKKVTRKMIALRCFREDYYRKYGEEFKAFSSSSLLRMFNSPAMKWALAYRMKQRMRTASFTIWDLILNKYNREYGLEIYSFDIGHGFYMGHPHNITINKDVKIGNNVNVHKGVTIGMENRGKRKGSPTIGSCVWIGVNATVVGNISIGDDVLIVANSFVNCDVPSHSIVYGNPCVVKYKDKATDCYCNNLVRWENSDG